jgi:hypothetical protein
MYEFINISLNMYHHLYQASASTMHQYQNNMNYNHDVSSNMHDISIIKHVPIILLVGASNNVPKVCQTCINYRSIYDSSMVYTMTTSSTHQLHVPICSSTTCQIHAPRYPTNPSSYMSMELKHVSTMYPRRSFSITIHLSIQNCMY